MARRKALGGRLGHSSTPRLRDSARAEHQEGASEADAVNAAVSIVDVVAEDASRAAAVAHDAAHAAGTAVEEQVLAAEIAGPLQCLTQEQHSALVANYLDSASSLGVRSRRCLHRYQSQPPNSAELHQKISLTGIRGSE